MQDLKRRQYEVIGLMLLACGTLTVRGEIRRSPFSNDGNDRAPTLVALQEPRVSAETFEWRYQIRNDSAHDIWVCASMGSLCCDAHLAADNETFVVRRHFDRQPERLLGIHPSARYVRLGSGETRAESMSFRLPLRPEYMFSTHRGRREAIEEVTHVVLEIGYYAGDLPGVIFDMLDKAQTAPTKTYADDVPPKEYDPSWFFAGTQGFLKSNEGRACKSEWVLVPYTWQTLKGERVLRLTSDNVRVPYLEEGSRVEHVGLGLATRLELKFKTSALEFFFPYAREQSLLNPAEQQYLRSMDGLVTKDRKLLKSVADEIRNGHPNCFVTERGIADLSFYSSYPDDHALVSLGAYDDSEIVTPEGQVFECLEGLGSLRRLTPQIESFDLRVQCATNLQDLWWRLRLYERIRAATSHEPARGIQECYPRPQEWCEAISSSYSYLDRNKLPGPYRCPSARRGKCHYAINPSCTYDAPPDMVLLFETKAGWNQHGGPKLFTFDNHDPKGGLVLLNDGTVKFIRTEEELKQLRWK